MTIKSVLFENLRIKLVVGALATLFWFAVVTENVYEHEVDVPITVVNMPAGKTLATDLPRTARVRFEGKGRALLVVLFSRDARVILDLAEVRRRHVFRLQRDMVHLSRGGAELTPLQILSPDTVCVRLTNLIAKPLRIAADVKITTVPGYTLVQPWRLVPDSVTVSGPEEVIRRLDSVMTEHREFSEVQQSISQRLRLQSFPESLRVQLSVGTTHFSADIQKLIEVTLSEIPVQMQNVPGHLKITPIPSTLTLTLEGGEQLLLNLKREDIVAYIDYARIRDLAADGYPAYIRTPAGVRYRDVKPTLFKLMTEVRNHASARH
ncbi:MAG: hypothetical protein ONB44_03885 [candidate division KSB1 bacterium]|nr:hypothetical protein [candidate division KSB1 bacterium]MDZ7301270.1 hypothetical protein [candidate division KSB1 bacterium]MDZ7310507.1 hypothetical protein [candidate division KSB1 bacterium]